MVTAIYSLSYVHGVELWLLFWFVCTVTYLSICFMIKSNRTKFAIKTTWIGLLMAEVLIDILWAFIYYRNGAYTNYGIGAVFGVLLWIPVLIITAVWITVRNKKSER